MTLVFFCQIHGLVLDWLGKCSLESFKPMLDELFLNIFFVNQTFTLKKCLKKEMGVGFLFPFVCGEF